ncbi:MAG: flagellar FlbD family protein [Clostridiales bacterium]|nr:flagellar FlbD family protein [Clostridiales bacterium]
MVRLTKLNGEELYLNPLIIESIEMVPDTVITLTNGKTIVVKDDIKYITDEVVSFYNRFHVFPADYYGKSKE